MTLLQDLLRKISFFFDKHVFIALFNLKNIPKIQRPKQRRKKSAFNIFCHKTKIQGFNNVIFWSLRTSFHCYSLGKSKEELGENYWDLVVLTASDELQRDAYEKQINDKLKKKEIPSGIPYLVYADPPGPRAGTTFINVRNLAIVHSRNVKEKHQTNELFEPLPFYLKRTKRSINSLERFVPH